MSPTLDPISSNDPIDEVVRSLGISVRAPLREYQDRAIQGNAMSEPVYISCLELDISYSSVSKSCAPTTTLCYDPLVPASLVSGREQGGGGGGRRHGHDHAYATHRDESWTRYGYDDGARLSGMTLNDDGDEIRRVVRHDCTSS